MLEKIGLPEKPSLRGNNWVVDASHCQGCSSQFTMFNRKHHCRRCGGLFCNSCTQQRLRLRGQGDSPVRICDPCKKLEEAARVEVRQGYRSRATKGGKLGTRQVDDSDVNIGTDDKQKLLLAKESVEDMVSNSQKNATGPSSLMQIIDASSQGNKNDISGNSSDDIINGGIGEMESTSPEKLRVQAQEEKKKHGTLKREGKSAEALRAFKRGKELERQAVSLEHALRKSRRAPSVASSINPSKTVDRAISSAKKGKMNKEDKESDDLLSELRELGWSETDADKKSSATTLEGELINLLGEMPQKSVVNIDADNSQVMALKRNALKLKREGRLVEAKEELKKAKILEKELEEKALLGQDEESDDEIVALIRTMDDSDQKDISMDFTGHTDFDLRYMTDLGDDATDDNFEVTNDDMNDPEMAAALKSFGWDEEGENEDFDTSSPLDLEAIRNEVLSLKREALKLKREGNITEAREHLKKAKLLEQDLEDFDVNSQGNMTISRSSDDKRDFGVSAEAPRQEYNRKGQSKSKSEIQKELLGLKRKALALRREGRVDEAEEELNKCKALEILLDETENASKMGNTVAKVLGPDGHGVPGPPVLVDEEIEEVSEKDMQDPSLLSILHTLGWDHADDESMNRQPESSKRVDHLTDPGTVTSVVKVKVQKSRAELQKELLGIKRKSLALRRQGNLEEAEEELKKATVLEAQIEKIDSTIDTKAGLQVPESKSPTQVVSGPSKQARGARNVQEEINGFSATENLIDHSASCVDTTMAQRSRSKIQRELLAIKRTALALRREGKFDEAEAQLEKAKLLEDELEKIDASKQGLVSSQNSPENGRTKGEPTYQPDLSTSEEKKGSHLAFKVDAEYDFSSSEGATLSDATEYLPKDNIGGMVQNFSNLSSVSVAKNRKKSSGTSEGISYDRTEEEVQSYVKNAASAKKTDGHASEQVLAHKRKAIALKREGKLAEAREELRRAKMLEKALEDGENDLVNNSTSAVYERDGSQESQTSFSNQTVTVPSVSVSTDSLTSHRNKNVEQAAKPLSGRDRFKLQQQALAHKRRSLQLKREGQLEEAEKEFELAKSLESQLEQSGGSNGSHSHADTEATDDAALLDPEILSALQAIGMQGIDIQGTAQQTQASKGKASIRQLPASLKVEPSKTPNQDQTELEEKIKAEKMQALNLKRSGKQDEAMDALRRAKVLEKKLNALLAR